MERYELSVCQAEVPVLARRMLFRFERVPCLRVVPVGDGVHVALPCLPFTVLARKTGETRVDVLGRAIMDWLRFALAARHRLGKRIREPGLFRVVVRVDSRRVA